VTNIDCLFILLQEARWAFKWSGFFIPLEIKIYAVGADGNIVTGGAKYNCPSISATTTPLNHPFSRVNGRKILLTAPRGKLGPLIV
jgi:hypothetical protein